MAKWNAALAPFAEVVRRASREGPVRHAPFDLIRFPTSSREHFIDRKGRVQLSFGDVEWQRL